MLTLQLRSGFRVLYSLFWRFFASIRASLIHFSAWLGKGNAGSSYPFDEVTLTAPDGSITAKFVSFGATLTELWVPDKFGSYRDVVLGYDDKTLLETDPAHPVFNAIVGRYANRIRNGTFTIPTSKDPSVTPSSATNIYHIPRNDFNGQNTLHGGNVGWDRRRWTVVELSPTHVIYKHVDNGDEGFPGIVTAFVQHSVDNGGILRTTVKADATELTPIMLTQHNYWNLNAFQLYRDTPHASDDTILDHVLHLPLSPKVIESDQTSRIPTGAFIDVSGTAYDFRQPRVLSGRWSDTEGYAGLGQLGYNDCFIIDRQNGAGAECLAISLYSPSSGIRLDVSTDQSAVQIYTGNWLSTIRKRHHYPYGLDSEGRGPGELKYAKWSALAIEQQGYNDAINNPEWGVDQIYGPDREYQWASTYQFSVDI